MAQQRIFPFRRVSVDHMVRGTTRVWWQLEPLFREPGPHSYQLQVGKTGLSDAADWENVGPAVTDAYMAYDPVWRLGGYDLLLHYRVVLTTPTNVYISQPASCYGELNERDWVLAREIIRKEQLRHKYVSVPGYLLKIMRFGTPCPRCRDPLTKEITSSYCPVCSGTGFEVGYHPPLPMQCWDMSPQSISEDIDAELKGSTREIIATARVIGFPALNKYDVWVNAHSDERWKVDTIQVAAAMRGVPLVYQIQLRLMPFTDAVYGLEVGGEAADWSPLANAKPTTGCGATNVDQSYVDPDRHAYVNAAGCPISGANVYVFAKDLYEIHGVGLDKNLAIASTTTTANGRWVREIKLDPGDYAIIYEKPGQYGPDVDFMAVVAPGEPQNCEWLPSVPISEGEDELPLGDEDGTTLGTADEFKVCDDNVILQMRAAEAFIAAAGSAKKAEELLAKATKQAKAKTKKPNTNDFWAI